MGSKNYQKFMMEKQILQERLNIQQMSQLNNKQDVQVVLKVENQIDNGNQDKILDDIDKSNLEQDNN